MATRNAPDRDTENGIEPPGCQISPPNALAKRPIRTLNLLDISTAIMQVRRAGIGKPSAGLL